MNWTISNDRIRRVAEKHPELQVKCHSVWTPNVIAIHHDHSRCMRCLGTLWYPLDVRDWADALIRAKVYAVTLFMLFDTVICQLWDKEHHLVAHTNADNAEDALLMALEQADGVKE